MKKSYYRSYPQTSSNNQDLAEKKEIVDVISALYKVSNKIS